MKQTKQTDQNTWLLPSFRKGLIIKKVKKTIGVICLIVAILPNGLFGVFMPISLMLLGLSLEQVKDYKRIAKCKLRGWL